MRLREWLLVALLLSVGLLVGWRMGETETRAAIEKEVGATIRIPAPPPRAKETYATWHPGESLPRVEVRYEKAVVILDERDQERGYVDAVGQLFWQGDGGTHLVRPFETGHPVRLYVQTTGIK